MKSIFIVEDEHSIRVVLRQQCLEADGYFVVAADQGAAALTMLENMTAPSLIILDVNMPGGVSTYVS